MTNRDAGKPRRPLGRFGAGVGWGLCAATWVVNAVGAGDAEPKRPVRFERDVWPIIAASCLGCHGTDKPKAGLDLRTVSCMLRGGESGPAIDRSRPEASLLLERVARGEMPPGKARKLSVAEVAVVRAWLREGAHADHPDRSPDLPGAVRDQDRRFWSFCPLARPAVPNIAAAERARTPIDRFLLSTLESKGLSYSADAPRTTLVRRAYLDLIGLPPAPEEIDRFLADSQPGAYERLVDRLLESPHFGERWGRHWLDVAGYVDTVGFDTDATNIITSEGKWRYRDYVIRSFNQDKPFDQFITEQIAGDELHDWRRAPHLTPAMRECLIATGYLRTARDMTHEDVGVIPQNFVGVVHDTLEIVGTGLLGLTINCARCHDHKFDPIPQEDYYRMMAVLAPAYNPEAWLAVIPTETKRKDRGLPDVSPAEQAEIERHNAAIDRSESDLRGQLDRIRRASGEKAAAAKIDAQIAAFESRRQRWNKIQALYDFGPVPVTHVLVRGSEQTPGAAVPAGFLRVLCPTDRDALATAKPPFAGTTGRRTALARWLTAGNSPAAALAARVMVNRVWKELFGQGIVPTPENFGVQGQPPTHPALLEWLSFEFRAGGSRLKPLIKLMVCSTAYRQASRHPRIERDSSALPEKIDPANELLWRMRLRRVDAETVRDAILVVSGDLDRAASGPPVMISARTDGMVTVAGDSASSGRYRRSIYLLARRAYNLSLLTVFDQPLVATNCVQRTTSALPQQSLFMLNDAFLAEQAGHFARRVERGLAIGAPAEAGIDLAFRIALGRLPTASEAEICRTLLRSQRERFLSSGRAPAASAHEALSQVCLTLLNTSEFLYAE